MNEKLSLFMSKVYGLMTLGVLLTSVSATVVGTSPKLMELFIGNTGNFIALILIQLILVILIMVVARIANSIVAGGLFLLYSAVSGLTLSVIFIKYNIGDISNALLTTVIAFAGLSIFGFVTKKNLDALGSFLMMALFGLIGVSLLSIFVPSLNQGTIGIIKSLIGLLIFSGLTAYDTQKIKEIGLEDDSFKNVVMGALRLYLDFVNMFLEILKLTGNSDD